MALEKVISVDLIEVVANGAAQVRTKTVIMEDGKPITEEVAGIRTHFGLISQEVKQAIDTAGVDFGGWVLTDTDTPDSQQALRYDEFISPIIKAIQELAARVEYLERTRNEAHD